MFHTKMSPVGARQTFKRTPLSTCWFMPALLWEVSSQSTQHPAARSPTPARTANFQSALHWLPPEINTAGARRALDEPSWHGRSEPEPLPPDSQGLLLLLGSSVIQPKKQLESLT